MSDSASTEPINPRKVLLLVLLFPIVIGPLIVAVAGQFVGTVEIWLWCGSVVVWLAAWTMWAGRWRPGDKPL